MSHVNGEMVDVIPMPPRILGLGVACVDMIACVEEYPKADEKIRAESVTLLSGGNVGNTLTAISKLGAAEASILTKVGKDSNGEFVINDLRKVGVDVSNAVVSVTAPTLLVYVIVDKQAKRTCIASPNEEELTPTEVETKLHVLNQISGKEEDGTMLDGVQMVHLDSRHTAAAIVLAKEANLKNIPVSLDIEKDRVHLKELMPSVDIFFTNQDFPQSYYNIEEKDTVSYDANISLKEYNGREIEEEDDNEDGEKLSTTLLSMSCIFATDKRSATNTYPLGGKSRAELVVTTRGALGSLLMRRKDVIPENQTDGIKAQVPFSRKGSFLMMGVNPMDGKPVTGIRNSGQIPNRKGSFIMMGVNPMDKIVGTGGTVGNVDQTIPVGRKSSFMMMGENPMDKTAEHSLEHSSEEKIQKRGSFFEGENPMDKILIMEENLDENFTEKRNRKSSFIMPGDNPMTEEGTFEMHRNQIFLNENLLTIAPIRVNHYVFSRLVKSGDVGGEREEYEVIKCAAWPISVADIVDSTGAGDAYIGGFISGLSSGYSDENCMKLGTSVANAKLYVKGARDGLPTAHELNQKIKAFIESKQH